MSLVSKPNCIFRSALLWSWYQNITISCSEIIFDGKATKQVVSSYLWSVDMKLAGSAYSHALDKITWSFYGNYALLGCLAPFVAGCSYIYILVLPATAPKAPCLYSWWWTFDQNTLFFWKLCVPPGYKHSCIYRYTSSFMWFSNQLIR